MGDTVLLVINEQKLDALNHGLLSKLYRNLLLILSERLRERVEERKAQYESTPFCLFSLTRYV